MSVKSVCDSCGTTLDKAASFCPSCGSPMKTIENNPAVNTGAAFQPYQQSYQQPYQQQPYGNTAAYNNGFPQNNFGYMNVGIQQNVKSNVPGIIGLLMGILSILLFLFNLLDLPLVLTGLILSIVGLTGKRRKGTAVAGLVCSIIGLLLVGLLFLRMWDITWGFSVDPNELFPDHIDWIIEGIFDF